MFLLGTNWVPLDAFPSQNAKRLDRALELLWDIGCNAVRCWGGGVYESDEFYRYCDRHGIVVWQDFAMGCAVYPQEQDFAKMLEEEAVHTVKRLRNHACIILWAGDQRMRLRLCLGRFSQRSQHEFPDKGDFKAGNVSSRLHETLSSKLSVHRRISLSHRTSNL